MKHRHQVHRRAAALVSAVAILLVVAAFAAVFLSVHTAQLSAEQTAIHRLRAEAATMAGTHLALWKVSNEPDLQDAVARVVYEHDTSFEADPLFRFQGDLAGATFTVDLWPGADAVRLKATGVAGGAYFERWAHMPARPTLADNLLIGGDFEDAGVISRWPIWLGQASLGTWCAGYGLSRVDNPRPWGFGTLPWNITRAGGNHFAEELRWSNTIAQYIEGQGAGGTLVLDFDYLSTQGDLRVVVRGVDTLPRLGLLFPGTSGYKQWTSAGTVLYDSGNLAAAEPWSHFTTTLDAGAGYKYYAVQVSGRGGSGTPSSPQRAIDNISLSASR